MTVAININQEALPYDQVYRTGYRAHRRTILQYFVKPDEYYSEEEWSAMSTFERKQELCNLTEKLAAEALKMFVEEKG